VGYGTSSGPWVGGPHHAFSSRTPSTSLARLLPSTKVLESVLQAMSESQRMARSTNSKEGTLIAVISYDFGLYSLHQHAEARRDRFYPVHELQTCRQRWLCHAEQVLHTVSRASSDAVWCFRCQVQVGVC